LQTLARADGLCFSFPLLVYGVAGAASAPLLAFAPLRVYEAWWLLVAVGAPILIMLHYQRRLRARGVGIGRPRALRYVFGGEALALALWVQPYHPIMINAPWLAFVLFATLVGRRWREPSMCVAAGGVAVIVLGAAALGWPMALTDLVVGAWLCVSARMSWSRAARVPAGMVAPFTR
jgi:hypothetical protein